jgi:hypothetical protein
LPEELGDRVESNRQAEHAVGPLSRIPLLALQTNESVDLSEGKVLGVEATDGHWAQTKTKPNGDGCRSAGQSFL